MQFKQALVHVAAVVNIVVHYLKKIGVATYVSSADF